MTVNYSHPRENNKASWENSFVWFTVYNVKWSDPIKEHLNKGYSHKVRINMHHVIYMEPISGDQCRDLYWLYLTNGQRIAVMNKKGVY